MDKKHSSQIDENIVSSVQEEMQEPRLAESVRDALGTSADSTHIDSEAVRAQIAKLRQSLAENERSWKATGFTNLKNPIAESILWDIDQKEKLLGLKPL